MGNAKKIGVKVLFIELFFQNNPGPRTECITWPSIRPVSFQDSPVTYLLLVSLEERYIKITRVRIAK